MKDRKPPTSNPEEEVMETRLTTKRAKGGQAALGRDVQAKIGQQLRAYYDSLVEPPPDRFAELLQRLEKSGGKEPSE